MAARTYEREIVTATAMAEHLFLDRSYLARLQAQGAIEKRGDGKYDLAATRRAYITYLREERKRSPRTEADVSYQTARADLIRLRILERQKQLIPAEVHDAFVEDLTGLVLAGLSGLSAKCSRDLAVRRDIDKAVFELRRELAQAAIKLADERGEPALDESMTPRRDAGRNP